ncbi:MAG: metallophosphoesterase family protein [Victivallales bacterium]|nr:metallophosphoesterase family protein [Victivallales bacterium]
MKYAILGDIHGNLEALNTVLDFAKAEGAEKFICIGDVVGYNANPHECLKTIRELDLLGLVKGNHDDYVSNGQETIGFNPMAAQAVEWTRDQMTKDDLAYLTALDYKKNIIIPGYGRIEIVHATLDNPKGWGYIFDRYSAETSLAYQKFPICFVGHTHVPLMFDKFESTITGGFYDVIHLEPNHKYLINVGSVGQPHDGNPKASIAIFDSSEQTVTLTRLDYDLETTQQKILDAGLPERLATRLALGR